MLENGHWHIHFSRESKSAIADPDIYVEVDGGTISVAMLPKEHSIPGQDALARRVAACLRVCEGMSTESMEAGFSLVDLYHETLMELVQVKAKLEDLTKQASSGAQASRPKVKGLGWEMAPGWAKYAAMDACGRWHWYEASPQLQEKEEIWLPQPATRAASMKVLPDFHVRWNDSLCAK